MTSVLETMIYFFFRHSGRTIGHVTMESLLVGTPVLIADTTPWRNLEQAGVGWDLPLNNEQRFADKIHDIAKFSNEDYGIWRNKVRAYARERAADPQTIAANRKLFKEAVETETQ